MVLELRELFHFALLFDGSRAALRPEFLAPLQIVLADVLRHGRLHLLVEAIEVVGRVACAADQRHLRVAHHGAAVCAPDALWAAPELLRDAQVLLVVLPIEALNMPRVVALGAVQDAHSFTLVIAPPAGQN